MDTKQLQNNSSQQGKKDNKAANNGKTAAAAGAGAVLGAGLAGVFNGHSEEPDINNEPMDDAGNGNPTDQNAEQTDTPTEDNSQEILNEGNDQTAEQTAQETLEPETANTTVAAETPSNHVASSELPPGPTPGPTPGPSTESGSQAGAEHFGADPTFDMSQIDQTEQVSTPMFEVVSSPTVKIVNGEEVIAVEVDMGDGEHVFLVDLDGDGMFNQFVTADGHILSADGVTPFELPGHYTLGDLEHMHESHIGIEGYSRPEVASLEHGQGVDETADIVNTGGGHTQSDSQLAENTPGQLADNAEDGVITGMPDTDAQVVDPSELDDVSGEDVYAQLFGDVDPSEDYLYDDVFISETEISQSQPDSDGFDNGEIAQFQNDGLTDGQTPPEESTFEDNGGSDYASEYECSTPEYEYGYEENSEDLLADDPSAFHDYMQNDTETV